MIATEVVYHLTAAALALLLHLGVTKVGRSVERRLQWRSTRLFVRIRRSHMEIKGKQRAAQIVKMPIPDALAEAAQLPERNRIEKRAKQVVLKMLVEKLKRGPTAQKASAESPPPATPSDDRSSP